MRIDDLCTFQGLDISDGHSSPYGLGMRHVCVCVCVCVCVRERERIKQVFVVVEAQVNLGEHRREKMP